MIAENIFTIALHLPEEELERLYVMLDEKVNSKSITKRKKKKMITDKEAIDYLLKNVFSKAKNP